MKMFFLLLPLVIFSSMSRGALWDPIGGEYSFEVSNEIYVGEYPLVFSSKPGLSVVSQKYEIRQAGVTSSFNFIDAGHIGYISALVTSNEYSSISGWFDFYSPEGRWFTIEDHPSVGLPVGYSLDGEPMVYGETLRVEGGLHRISFNLQGFDIGGANLEVSPVPEPSALAVIYILVGSIAVYFFVRYVVKKTK